MRDEEIVKSTAVITVSDLMVAILGGFVVLKIFNSIGHSNKSIDENSKSGKTWLTLANN